MSMSDEDTCVCVRPADPRIEADYEFIGRSVAAW